MKLALYGDCGVWQLHFRSVVDASGGALSALRLRAPGRDWILYTPPPGIKTMSTVYLTLKDKHYQLLVPKPTFNAEVEKEWLKKALPYPDIFVGGGRARRLRRLLTALVWPESSIRATLNVCPCPGSCRPTR